MTTRTLLLLVCCCLTAGHRCMAAEKKDYSSQDLQNKDFTNENLNGACFDGAKLQNSKFTNATLKKATFKNANLENVNFRDAMLDGADFTGANLKKAVLSNAHAWHANFSGIEIHLARAAALDLTGVDYGARDIIRGSDDKTSGSLSFHYADLHDSRILGNADGVDFRGADLRGANLNGAENLDKALLKGAKFDKETMWAIDPDKSGAVRVEPETSKKGEAGTKDEAPKVKSPFAGKWMIVKGIDGAKDNGVLRIFSNHTFEWDPALSAETPKVLKGKWIEAGEAIKLEGGESGKTWSATQTVRDGKARVALKSEDGEKRFAVQDE